ncbi:hypothetical protein ANN_05519 [Periplaneta americana]|uniref:TIR domain-containing protein n=1 Tax=Periplaneta americana TaxID=6978 RepID=A0ABQ8TB20_PERAM|nr:hypothetical protein ANN_05519 [Periplaneta americana]
MPGNFQEAPNIEDLSLSSTKIQMIPEGISLLPNLKRLDLSGNILNYSQLQFSNILHNLTNLTWLSFSHTNLKSLEYLHHLLLGGNNSVSHIRLQHLDISNCGISDLGEEKIFREQLSLRNINLSGNNMKLIPPKLFVGFPELRYINLSHLNLREGPNLELGLKKVLQYIDLSYNKLRYPGDILSSGTVSELDLSHNSIKSWSDPFVFAKHDISSKYNESTTVYHTWVDNLNLSYNLMPTITKTMGASMKPLASVDLGKNPFQCMDCHVEEFKIWFQNLQKESGVVEILLLREKGIPMCMRSDSLSLNTILDAYLPDTCFNRVINYWVVAGIIAVSFLVLGVVFYLVYRRFKFEISYIMFLLKQKKKRDSVENNEDFEYDAFVSYSRFDRQWVLEEMTPALENCEEEFRLCLHERDFILGSFISLNIVRSMQRSRFTILVLSNNFVKSQLISFQWCRWEMEMANHKVFETGREFLILVELERLDQKIVPAHLRLLMDTRTYLEWPERDADATEAWKRLRACLGKSLHLQEDEDSTLQEDQGFEELSL